MGTCYELFLNSNFLYEKVICLISVVFSVSRGKVKKTKHIHVVQVSKFICTELEA